MSGLTDQGLVIELIPDIRAGMETDFRSQFFKSLPLGDKTWLGHMTGIVAERLGLLWEKLEQINSSQDRDKAVTLALESLCSMTGTFRIVARQSFCQEILAGVDGTVIVENSGVATLSTGKLFLTVEDCTLTLLDAWLSSTGYTVGQRVTNVAQCYECITSGNSNGSGGPTTQATDIPDGTVHWRYIGQGSAVADVGMVSQDTGEIIAIAGDLTSIRSPVSGWLSALNIEDADAGADTQTDEELRISQVEELEGAGGTTHDALRSVLRRNVTGVISANIFTNNTDAVNGDGLPPHSFETLVLGGADQDVVNAIAQNQPEGIATYSSDGTNGTYVDSEGESQAIYYTRPTDVIVYLDVTLVHDSSYPADGDSQSQAAIAAAVVFFPVGRDVDPSAMSAPVFSVTGVLRVPQVLCYTDVIGTPSAWLPTHLYSSTVGSRSVVTNDGGRVYICKTGGVSNGSGGPTGVGSGIVDGAATWDFLGAVSITKRQLASVTTNHITIHSSLGDP